MDPNAVISGLVNWPFMNEPIYRWFVFILIMSAFLSAWSGVLRHMK